MRIEDDCLYLDISEVAPPACLACGSEHALERVQLIHRGFSAAEGWMCDAHRAEQRRRADRLGWAGVALLLSACVVQLAVFSAGGGPALLLCIVAVFVLIRVYAYVARRARERYYRLELVVDPGLLRVRGLAPDVLLTLARLGQGGGGDGHHQPMQPTEAAATTPAVDDKAGSGPGP